MKNLMTKRLVLRKVEQEDAELLHSQQGCNPVITQYTGWNPYATLESTRKKIAEDIAGCAENGFYSWVITRDGEVIGTIGAYGYEPETLSIEIGYTIFEKAWGWGFASEATEEVVRYLFKDEKFNRIHAWCHARNRASARVLEKAGLKLEERRKQAMRNNDGSFDEQEIYGINRSEWKRNREWRCGMNTTLNYYNQNAENFVTETVSADLSKIQERFLGKLRKGAFILDFGCGSGRDTKCFLEQGYNVDAIDGSEELCRKACDFTKIQVRQMLFWELDEEDKYDGIWACSSILHLPKSELFPVFERMLRALKNEGVIYSSFKYGEYEGERNGRYFTDFTIDTFTMFSSEIQGMSIEECWITEDARPGREEERWLNLILRKSTKRTFG